MAVVGSLLGALLLAKVKEKAIEEGFKFVTEPENIKKAGNLVRGIGEKIQSALPFIIEKASDFVNYVKNLDFSRPTSLVDIEAIKQFFHKMGREALAKLSGENLYEEYSKNKALIQKLVDDQIALIKEVKDNPAKAKQVFELYKNREEILHSLLARGNTLAEYCLNRFSQNGLAEFIKQVKERFPFVDQARRVALEESGQAFAKKLLTEQLQDLNPVSAMYKKLKNLDRLAGAFRAVVETVKGKSPEQFIKPKELLPSFHPEKRNLALVTANISIPEATWQVFVSTILEKQFPLVFAKRQENKIMLTSENAASLCAAALAFAKEHHPEKRFNLNSPNKKAALEILFEAQKSGLTFVWVEFRDEAGQNKIIKGKEAIEQFVQDNVPKASPKP